MVALKRWCQAGGLRAKCSLRRNILGARKDFVAQCECLASKFGLRKIVLQKKNL